jgi:hypothetical protein
VVGIETGQNAGLPLEAWSLEEPTKPNVDPEAKPERKGGGFEFL